ncbi:MAG: F0F1 ATP synthase subunit B [Dehalococcoidia bacterium]|nr:MAG: F0F1 ATP synthase subunit B [Dehalococcoidia bacterium]
MEGGLGSLGIEPSILLAQVINFVILFGLLYFVAYKPLMRMLDNRSKKIKESMEHTEYIKEQAELAERETAKRIQEATKEGQKIIMRAEQAGEEARQKAREEASVEAERLIGKAQIEIQRERDAAVADLQSQFANLTVLAAGKVIDQTLDKEGHKKLIEKTLEESSGIK